MTIKNRLLKAAFLWLLLFAYVCSVRVVYATSTGFQEKLPFALYFLAIQLNPKQHIVVAPNGTPSSRGAAFSHKKSTKPASESNASTPSNSEVDRAFNSSYSITLHRLNISLKNMDRMLHEHPDWIIVLVWDIDGTILYTPPNFAPEPLHNWQIYESQANFFVSDSFDKWRHRGQLLLIFNTARPYETYHFFDPRSNLPRADIVISNGGTRYFINNTLETGLAGAPAHYIESYTGVRFPDINWENAAPLNCERSNTTSSMTTRCRRLFIPNNYNWYQALHRVEHQYPEIHFWRQYAGTREQDDILFAFHENINKGAAFARWIHQRSCDDENFRKKKKLVMTAGDRLHDTSMMNARMYYPFETAPPKTALNPGLPDNTDYVGTVLSKSGDLQSDRFKTLFDQETTVHSKIKSITGIIVGTETLLSNYALQVQMQALSL